MTNVLRLSLPRTVTSPRTARQALDPIAREYGLELQVLAVIVSELVTNAVVHGGSPISLTADWDGACMLIGVTDGNPDIAAVTLAPVRAPNEPGGRGLRLVERLARRWGVGEHADGKTVWAEVEPAPA